MCLWLTAAVFLVASWMLVFNGSSSTADEDLEQEFRDLFERFFLKPVQRRGLKRDTSKAKDHQLPSSIKPTQQRDAEEPKLSPLFNCNHFEASTRLCVNIRQLGTTLTIGVRVDGNKKKSPVHWYRVFHVRGQNDQKFSFIEFTKEAVPWNINIGGDDNELRISPITEMDFGRNFFLATLDTPTEKSLKQGGRLPLLMFRIEPIPINMGTLYHGEEITISIRSHMELPASSVQYEWSRVGEDFEAVQNLPSNMKLNRDGSAILIKEYRSARDMLVTCTVYSNKNVTLARRNFFLPKIVSAKNPNLKVERIRKRRFLDEFYAASDWNPDDFSKSKREVLPPEEAGTTETETNDPQQPNEDEFPPMEFSEINLDQQPTTSQLVLMDRPDQTVLNFYAQPPSAERTKNRMEPKLGKPKSKPQELHQLIEEANSIVEQEPEVIENGEPPYSTIKIVTEERLTFEDKESAMIANCNRDSDCGINAICLRVEETKRLCRCKPHFKGNGMFCWLF